MYYAEHAAEASVQNSGGTGLRLGYQAKCMEAQVVQLVHNNPVFSLAQCHNPWTHKNWAWLVIVLPHHNRESEEKIMEGQENTGNKAHSKAFSGPCELPMCTEIIIRHKGARSHNAWWVTYSLSCKKVTVLLGGMLCSEVQRRMSYLWTLVILQDWYCFLIPGVEDCGAIIRQL